MQEQGNKRKQINQLTKEGSVHPNKMIYKVLPVHFSVKKLKNNINLNGNKNLVHSKLIQSCSTLKFLGNVSVVREQKLTISFPTGLFKPHS